MATSPTMRIERSEQYRRSACHCSWKANCKALRIFRSTARSFRAFCSAPGCRCANSTGHSFQLASLYWARNASNRTKSSSHHAFSEQKCSKRCHARSEAEVTKLRPGPNKRRLFRRKEITVLTRAESERSDEEGVAEDVDAIAEILPASI